MIAHKGFPEIILPREKAFDLEDFRQMDYYAVENYQLPIELMMENAGLQLANLIAHYADKNDHIIVGVGNGNNGGGGLVAARRLAAWNFSVSLDIPAPISKKLPKQQLSRALAFGVQLTSNRQPDIWVDAYLGFSQRLPLSLPYLKRIQEANKHPARRVSLDIPTGYLGNTNEPYFNAQKVLSLAAPKKILYDLDDHTELFVADIGIPASVYEQFHTEILNFDQGNILHINRNPKFYQLETERLILAEVSQEDMNDIHELHSIPVVDEFNTLGIPETIHDTEKIILPYLEERLKKPRASFMWKIVLKESNQFIGLAGLSLSNDKFKLGEIYYKFHPDFWGKGYATETAKRLIVAGFEDFDLQKVEAGVATENTKSIKVLEKAGMTREGIRRKILPIRGEWKDNYHYAIVKTDPRS